MSYVIYTATSYELCASNVTVFKAVKMSYYSLWRLTSRLTCIPLMKCVQINNFPFGCHNKPYYLSIICDRLERPSTVLYHTVLPATD